MLYANLISLVEYEKGNAWLKTAYWYLCAATELNQVSCKHYRLVNQYNILYIIHQPTITSIQHGSVYNYIYLMIASPYYIFTLPPPEERASQLNMKGKEQVRCCSSEEISKYILIVEWKAKGNRLSQSYPVASFQHLLIIWCSRQGRILGPQSNQVVWARFAAPVHIVLQLATKFSDGDI